MSDIEPIPADQVETSFRDLTGKLVVTRKLIGRPDITMKDWDTSRKPRTWAPSKLIITWINNIGGPNAVTGRGPWCVQTISLWMRLRLKSGGISEDVTKQIDLSIKWDILRGEMGFVRHPLPDYIVPCLDNMIPSDWNTAKDGVPVWRPIPQAM